MDSDGDTIIEFYRSSTSDDEAPGNATANEWRLKPELEAFQERNRFAGIPPQSLGVTWQGLTVRATRADSVIHENALSQLDIRHMFRSSAGTKPKPQTILDRTSGCVKPGEMLLVLGRPGSGCTTLLKMLANKRRGYGEVTGEVRFGSMSADQAANYPGQIVMNTEEEVFYPSLTVGQTMDFATRLKISAALTRGGLSKEEQRLETKNFLLRSMGIEHTNDTKVGNEYVRGVSGGERKRVSIIETFATRGSVFCWDNSTRGLDANTALEYVKAVRAMTDVMGLASIVTLYQAGNGIYNLFDKVLVLDEGKQIYYGPVSEARPFMESLGFICSDGANVADFLTGVTVPTERRICAGYESTFPRDADEVRQAYEGSPIYARMMAECDYPSTQQAADATRRFREGVQFEKDPHLSEKSPMTVGFATQVWTCIIRQYQVLWGDKASLFVKQGSSIAQALIAGSLFYQAPSSSAGLFIKSGALFFALLFNSLLAMSEVTDSFVGRPVVVKQKEFAFFHPAAYCIAQIAADIPVILFQVSAFTIIIYFMGGLKQEPGAYFTLWIIVIMTTMCMTAMFRAIGAAFNTFDDASKVSGFMIAALMMYTGYMIQKPYMHPWFVWLFWINPIAYAFDALLSNEFHDTIIDCVGTNLVPSGPGYGGVLDGQACAGVGGAIPRQTFVTGDDYLSSLSYGYSHVWRNFGIIVAFWVFFVVVTVICSTMWRPSVENGPSLVTPREVVKKVMAPRQADEEGQVYEMKERKVTRKRSELMSGSDTEAEMEPSSHRPEKKLPRNRSVFTWKNLTYTVKTPTGDRTLLNNIQGWVKPGELGALMGSSGAGKTTLLDVLAQRKTEGTIRGTVLLDGRPLPVSFQRSAGYCEQLDVHEPYATVREALEFSALLRQSRDTPRAEKLRYVDTIIDLLELHDLADTLVGRVGAGLTVEQRKRVTIGVELVAKPSILIFLDEPTSGLDGQSAYDTVRFLRKLAAGGQAVLVTIHQPSAQLFSQFDTLLLLTRGGRTVYFGDIGDDAQTVKDYFARYGAPCPRDANPAEHMIDVVSGNYAQNRDWAEVWLASPEHKAVSAEVDRINNEAASRPSNTVDDGEGFAVSFWEQVWFVTSRMSVSLFRNTDYVNNKLALHIGSALFNGFSFWMVGDSVGELQLKVFTVFNFVFVAPGVLAQLQPVFLQRRDLFEAREKKSRTYSWVAFVSALILSEIPYLCICAVVYFVCWYYTVGFPTASSRAGGTFVVMLLYEFMYTGIGQFVAAYAPNAVAAALVNPLLIGTLVSIAGVLVPYSQIQPFWRDWMYWLNPFNYLLGSMLVFGIWGADVQCATDEFAVFDPPGNGTMTCAEYLGGYLSDGPGAIADLVNPNATSGCHVCSFSRGEDYLQTLNLNSYSYAWRDTGIVAIFVVSSYMLVYVLMRLRTRASKTAER